MTPSPLDRQAGRRWGPLVAGVDEAGRGPWAGPLTAAAVILNPDKVPEGIKDSKKLSARRRETLEAEIKAQAACWAVAEANVDEIERLGPRRAALLAMKRAIDMLDPAPAAALIDGLDAPDVACDCLTVVKGDTHSTAIAAASILAKTARDRLMVAADETFPGYGFAEHKGYGAKAHAEALDRLGPCAIHRKTYQPVRLRLSNEVN